MIERLGRGDLGEQRIENRSEHLEVAQRFAESVKWPLPGAAGLALLPASATDWTHKNIVADCHTYWRGEP
jgi:hypothetical protein